VNLGEGTKFHAETLYINKLAVGETCEGCFQTFLLFHFSSSTFFITFAQKGKIL